MKAAIDELADKLVRQVKDIHDKRVGRRKQVEEPGPENSIEAGITET
jgi:ribosome-associated translation inhibitor RaiA